METLIKTYKLHFWLKSSTNKKKCRDALRTSMIAPRFLRGNYN
jgi:hypothetical protein